MTKITQQLDNDITTMLKRGLSPAYIESSMWAKYSGSHSITEIAQRIRTVQSIIAHPVDLSDVQVTIGDNTIITNGTMVKLVSGDRDRVLWSPEHEVKNLQPDGSCTFHNTCDYCNGNVNKINPELNPINHGNYSYILIKEK